MTEQEVLNAIGELSMEVNKLKSSLREFEKQRVNPKFEEVKREIDALQKDDLMHRGVHTSISEELDTISKLFDKVFSELDALKKRK